MSADTEKRFKTLLRELRPLFKENGFRASSQNFILESTECWVIVNFQKSRWAGPDETTFYVNVAASSRRWLGFFGKPPVKLPRFYEFDWQWRAEHFGRDKSVRQWTLCNDDSLQPVVTYLNNLLREFVFPATRTMVTEAGLMKHTGGFEYPQLKTRAVILAATNQVNELRGCVSTLVEKFGSGAVAAGTRNHLELLRLKYPEAMRDLELKASER